MNCTSCGNKIERKKIISRIDTKPYCQRCYRAEKWKRKSKNYGKKIKLTPEKIKQRNKEYQRKYQQRDYVKERSKEYQQIFLVKEKRKEYNQKYNLKKKDEN